MSSKEDKSTDNQTKALARIQAALDKYKIIKAPVLISDVVKHVFGDMKDDEKRADKAFKAVSSLVNELIDNGTIDSYMFVSSTMHPGQETPSIINEQMLVLPSFQLVGYTKTSFEDQQAETASDDVLIPDSEEMLSEVLQQNTAMYAVVSSDKDGGQIVSLRRSGQSAVGKFMQATANDEFSASMYAMIPVRINLQVGIEDEEDSDLSEADDIQTE